MRKLHGYVVIKSVHKSAEKYMVVVRGGGCHYSRPHPFYIRIMVQTFVGYLMMTEPFKGTVGDGFMA
jgi:hypothetical protein